MSSKKQVKENKCKCTDCFHNAAANSEYCLSCQIKDCHNPQEKGELYHQSEELNQATPVPPTDNGWERKYEEFFPRILEGKLYHDLKSFISKEIQAARTEEAIHCADHEREAVQAERESIIGEIEKMKEEIHKRLWSRTWLAGYFIALDSIIHLLRERK